MTITQIASMSSTYRNLYVNQSQATKALNRVSSGYRINSAADDAAGLAISEGMRGQIRGLSKASENAQHAISLVQTAEGNLNTTSDILVRMKELTVKAADGTLGSDDRDYINKEFQALKSELDRISDSANYNGMKLLDGTFGGKQGTQAVNNMGISNIESSGTLEGPAKFTITEENGVKSITARVGEQSVTQELAAADTDVTFDFGDGNEIKIDFSNTAANLSEGVITNVNVSAGANVAADTTKASTGNDTSNNVFQIGANGGADQRLNLHINDMSSKGLGLDQLDLSTVEGANKAQEAIKNATNLVNSERANLGATTNRLEHAINNIETTKLNTEESESRIRDADLALEMMKFLQKDIQSQAAQAMMSQGMNLARSYVMGILMK